MNRTLPEAKGLIQSYDTVYMECDCLSAEHTLRFMVEEDGGVYLEVQLAQHNNVFKRLWLALKYVFGHRSVYGHWDCTLIGPDRVLELRDFLDTVSKKNKHETSSTTMDR